MNDKAWLLNPKAIAAAKLCIKIVENELGVKLKLSHPDFVELLYEYCDLTESEHLKKAFKMLVSLAGDDIKNSIRKTHQQNALPENVIKAFNHINNSQLNNSQVNSSLLHNSPDNHAHDTLDVAENFDFSKEVVNYQGKNYPRWKENKEFRGLYRGQARYA